LSNYNHAFVLLDISVLFPLKPAWTTVDHLGTKLSAPDYLIATLLNGPR